MMTTQLCNLVLTLVVGITVLAEAAPEYQTRPTCPYPACPEDCAVEYYRDSNNCLRCRCDPDDSSNPWERPWEKPCIDNKGVSHPSGSWFDHEDGCNSCFCNDGSATFCTRKGCRPPKEELWCLMGDLLLSQAEIDDWQGECVSCTCGGMKQEWDCQDVKRPGCEELVCKFEEDVFKSQSEIDEMMGECISCTCGGMGQEWDCQAVKEPRCQKPCIDSKGVSHPSGSSFPHEDGCNTCICHNGQALCTKMGCAIPIEDLVCWFEDVYKSQSEIDEMMGECISCTCGDNGQEWDCQDVKEPRCQKPCIDNGVSHPSGSNFDHHDGCNWCSCHNGNALCTLMSCERWPKGNNNL